MDALRHFKIPSGDYVVPHAGSMKAMNSPEYKAKLEKGPLAFMTVLKDGAHGAMGAQLGMWFCYSVLISIFTAYVTGRTLGASPEFITIFRFGGAIAFMGYSMALLQNSIWYKRKWSSTFKSMFDGLIYALVTAATFAWLWPAAV